DDVRYHDERMPAQPAREGALGLRLMFVIELLADALAELGGGARGVEPGRELLGCSHDQTQVLQICAYRGTNARVLHLDRHLTAVMKPGSIVLPAGGGRSGIRIEIGKYGHA